MARHPFFLLTFTLFATFVNSVQAQWVQANGPYGFPASCVAEIGTNIFAGPAYVGTNTSLYSSLNLGKSWTALDQFRGDGITALQVVGNKLNLITYTGIFCSTDSGITWKITHSSGWSVFYTLTYSNNVLMASGDSILVSHDSGLSWNPIPGPGFTIKTLATNGQALFAGVNHNHPGGLYRSTDDGSSWTLIGLKNHAVSALCAFGNQFFVATGDTGILATSDNGRSWTRDTSINQVVTCFAAEDGEIFAGTYGNGFFYSTDSGKTWNAANKGLTNFFVQCFAMNQDDVILGTDGVGVFRSTDRGKNWIEVPNNAVRAENINDLVLSNNIIYAASGGSGVYRSIDGGASWQAVDAGLPYLGVRSITTIGSNVIAGLDYFGAFWSSDSGAHWLPTNLQKGGVLGLVRSGSELFAALDGGGIGHSVDSGRSWRTYSGLPNNTIRTLAALDHYVFATTNNYGTYRSSNYGVDWLSIEVKKVTRANFDAIAVNGSTILASEGNTILQSLDSGLSWEVIDSSQFYWSAHSLVVHNNLAVAGCRGNGVLLSEEGWKNWKSVNTGLIDLNVGPVLLFDNTVFAGTANNSVWRRPLSEMIGQNAVTKPTAATNTIRCYPNPFSTSTQITFSPETSGHADISIVNQLGVEVARIFSCELTASERTFMWGKPTGLPDGMYECVIRMNGRVEKLPIMLIQ